MKNKILLIGVSALLLAACGGGNSSGDSQDSSIIQSSQDTPSSVVSSVSSSVYEGKTNDDFQKARLTYTDAKGIEQTLNMQTIFNNQDAPHLNPLEPQHVLVVPFGFTNDDVCEKNQTPETLEKINKTFFGTKEELEELGGWTSLAEFYNTSSYGKSTFEGKVMPNWCLYEGSSGDFYKKYGSNLGPSAAEYARKWYLSEYAKEDHGLLGTDAEPLSYFDYNGDGFIDLIWIVYSHPTGSTNDWWAYVTYTSNSQNKTSPSVMTMGFASVDWMNHSCNGYDPHTYIHETGHTYGLDDYYDYTNSWKPMGSVDFMDSNIGDHNMFSKFSLGWTSPWVVDDSALITLRPGTTTGDCFILPSPNYNGTIFDEYMMVELMAPVGLAERDYKNGYENTTGYSEPGLRITHVDARVYATGHHDEYLVDNPQDGIDFRVCNTKGGRIGVKSDSDYFTDENGDISYFSLLSMIESKIDLDNNWTKIATYNATNQSLFRKNARFNLKPGSGWGETFMPSKSNLWNKAKTTTGWEGNTQSFTIDEECTFNYQLKVISIEEDEEYGYVAQVQVTANAY